MRLPNARVTGMSLIELMVGMLIGLIGIVIITHLYVTNEQYKRSTTGAGTAQVNGTIALYTIERDARMAGFGVSHSGALGCGNMQYYYNGAYSSPPGPAGGALPPLKFVPLSITNNTGSPDQLVILYSTGNERLLPGQLSEDMPQPSAEFKVDGTAGFGTGGLVVVAQGNTCAIYQLTQVQTASSHLQHNPGVSAPYNPVGGTSLMPKFKAGALVFNLGTPVWRTYSIDTANNAYQLQLSENLGLLAGGTPMSLVDDIVDMQIQYGLNTDLDANNVVDAWTPTDPADWAQVIAVRIGLLARSGNYEKPENPGDPCSATTATPTWAGSATVDGAGNLSSVFTVPGGLPSCYKFRVFETVVPLRNMIWRPA